MAVVYNTTLKNNRLQLVSDLTASKVFAASTGTASAGQLVIGTAALSGATGVLVTIPLLTTPFTLSGSVVATLAGTPLSAVATAAGTAALAEFRNNAGTTIVSGLTVGTSAANIILPTLTIFVGGTLTIISGTIVENGVLAGTPTYFIYGF